MRRIVLISVFAACSSPAVNAPAPGHFDALAEHVMADLLANAPQSAIGLGLHERDGELKAITPAALDADRGRFHNDLGALEAVDVATLTPTQREDLAVLKTELRGELFNMDALDQLHTNPMTYADIGLEAYVVRPYAPKEQRAAAVAKVCTQLPAYLAQARKNLKLPMPRTWIDTALMQTKGLVEFIDHDLATELGDQPALAMCKSALAEQATWLAAQQPNGTEGFALGAEKFSKMLAETEGVAIDLPALQKIADDDLARNTQALIEAAHAIDASKTPAEIVAAIDDDRPTDTLVVATQQAAELRQFLIDHKIVSLPGSATCDVRETPVFKRWNAASLDGPGPFERTQLPYSYYISPPDPTWSAADQHAYLPSRITLMFTTIHEVYPGHFVQGIHSAEIKSRIVQAFGSYMTGEGWAHYTEEMMYDQGAAGKTPQAHIGQLTEALLRNVRFIVAIGEHTKGMTVAQAEALFRDRAFLDPGNAHQQAVRGTFDPMYLSYTVGKLAIKKLRTDWMASHPTATLGDFHDAFLAHAPAPMPVIRRAMMGDDSPVL
jgi:uncharacterized protein (DUF885 family)